MSPSDQMGADLKAARKKIRELVAGQDALLKAAVRVRARCQSMRFDRDAAAAMDDLSVAIEQARQAITNAEGKT